MRIYVRHQTTYSYTNAIPYSIQEVRMWPIASANQHIIHWAIKGETFADLPFLEDGYGNRVHTHTVNRWHDRSLVLVEGEVETSDQDGVIDNGPETLPTGFYLRSTPYTQATPEIHDFARDAIQDNGHSLPDRLDRLMNAIRERVDYQVGVTFVNTTAEEALHQRAGVCQDHAHLFIACCRALNIPARYVSGYLFTGEELEIEAAHAWAEAYDPDLGWIGFDVANRCRASILYVRVAIGLDYSYAAPIRGIWRGGGSEALDVRVQILQRSAAQQ